MNKNHFFSIPSIATAITVAAFCSISQSQVLTGTARPGQSLWPQQIAQRASASATPGDWEETLYLQSIPGVGESIREGLSTPVSELEEVDLAEFLDLV